MLASDALSGVSVADAAANDVRGSSEGLIIAMTPMAAAPIIARATAALAPRTKLFIASLVIVPTKVSAL
jgi:hypothetical protein